MNTPTLVLRACDLVAQLVALQESASQNAGRDALDVAADLERWRAERAAWWREAEAMHRDAPVPLVLLTERLGLSSDELDLLLVAVVSRADPSLWSRVVGPGQDARLTLERLLGLLHHSSAERIAARRLLSPRAALVRTGLVGLVPLGRGLHSDAIEVRAAGAVTNFVLGEPLVSGLLASVCELVEPRADWHGCVLPETEKNRVWEVVAGSAAVRERLSEWGYGDVLTGARGLTLLFAGPPGTGKSMFAHALAARLKRPVLRVHTSRLLAESDGIRGLLAEALRVATLADAVAVLDDCERLLADRTARFLALMEVLDQHEGVLVLTTNDASRIDYAMERRIQLRVDFEAPDPVQREQIWEVHLPPDAPLGEDIDVPALAGAYELTGARIRNAILIALAQMTAREEPRLTMARLREGAESQLGARLDNLAVRQRTDSELDRLVLPDKEREQVHEVLAACRHREYVLTHWGFGERLSSGRGLCVLFDGPPGTGKTFAAELLAGALKLELYRVHIPNIVSKWVGETERNIAEIFARARAARAVLLFDEADSLFGKRSQSTESATDRYANMEVNLLLQEIERYDGITFLTTNLFANLDEALQRRIQFRVTFPFPEPSERARIWSVLTPPQAPLAPDVDFDDLAWRFELAGGHIKNALLRSAYRARDEGGAICQRHLVEAALGECAAQGKIVREDLSLEPEV